MLTTLLSQFAQLSYSPLLETRMRYDRTTSSWIILTSFKHFLGRDIKVDDVRVDLQVGFGADDLSSAVLCIPDHVVADHHSCLVAGHAGCPNGFDSFGPPCGLLGG